MSKILELRTNLERQKGRRFQIQHSITTLQKAVKVNTKELHNHEKANEIIKEVSLQTQGQVSYHISDITSLALEAVFNNPYELDVEFVQRRNKTECDLLFSRDGHQMDPIDGSGVGAIDIAAFALRIAVWSMQTPRSRNTIILDEPFKSLDNHTDRLERASKVIKELSDRLGLQFIIITHKSVLTEYADKIFTIKLKKGVSHVRSEEGITKSRTQ